MKKTRSKCQSKVIVGGQIGDQLKPILKQKHRPKKNPTKKRPGYSSWAAMKNRCDNPKHRDHHRYGGKGITYDPRWKDFSAFIADMGPPPHEHDTLDRIDHEGDYCRKNCRWASKKQQARNRSTTRLVEHEGRIRGVIELAEERGIASATLTKRLDTGVPIEDALAQPVIRGGDPRARQRIRYSNSVYNRWPERLSELQIEKLEAAYQERSDGLSKPEWFLLVTEAQCAKLCDEIADDNPEDPDPDPALAARLQRLSRARHDARALIRHLYGKPQNNRQAAL